MAHEIMIWLGSAGLALQHNSRWMAWNLFLALLPLAFSLWLFSDKKLPQRWQWALWLLLTATLLPRLPYLGYHALHWLRDNRTNYIAWAIAIGLFCLELRWRRTKKLPQRDRPLLWWLGFFAFIAFLPNAPYVLTDVIHLIRDIRAPYSVWIISLVLIPQYLLFTLVGFQAYVLSLMNCGEYLKRQGWGKLIIGMELIFHALSAVGIYLGRFLRFNSWDIITELDSLASVVDDLVAKRPLLVMAITFATITILYWLMKQVTLGISDRNRTIALRRRTNINPLTINY
jgi:uncharacterized membrane protein